jgi:integrase
MAPANKGMKYPVDPYTREEIDALISACSPRYRTPCRNRAMLILMWRTGLRIGEVCSLQLHDLRLDQPGRPNSVRVQCPKGASNGKPPREVGIDDGTCHALRVWIEKFRGLAPGPLFTTRTGKTVDTQNLRRRIPQLARKAGLTRRAHAHAFRHTFCRELGNEGVDIVVRMEALGHSSLAVTTRYARSCGDSPAVAITAEREW